MSDKTNRYLTLGFEEGHWVATYEQVSDAVLEAATDVLLEVATKAYLTRSAARTLLQDKGHANVDIQDVLEFLVRQRYIERAVGGANFKLASKKPWWAEFSGKIHYALAEEE